MAKTPKNNNEPEQPRVEPEIIPPDRTGRGPRGGWSPDGTSAYATHRVYISRIGPIGFALLLLVVGLLAAVMLLVLIGTALIWIPLVAVLLVFAAISSILRRL
jgi:hypothetical protein